MDVLIRAAGGVLYRGPRSRLRVALVHRPRYDDWSLPKGKLKRGEHPLVGACREVWEETGVRPLAGARLPTVHYPAPARDGYARKRVDYWSMRVEHDDGFMAGDETDALSWLSVSAALRRLSYPRDVTVLSAFAALPTLRPPLILLRPTQESLAARLHCYGPKQLFATGEPRTAGTLEPLSGALAQPVTPLALPPALRDAAELLRSLPTPAVVCASTASLAALLPELTGRAYPVRSGQGWVLSFPNGSAEAVVDPFV